MREIPFKRSIDSSGKVNIPIEIRREMGWNTECDVELVLTKNGDVVIRSTTKRSPIEVKQEIINDIEYGFIDRAITKIKKEL